MPGFAEIAVNGVFATFGKPATYVPVGQPEMPCTVILDAADRPLDLAQSRGVVIGRVVEVRVSEVAQPVKGAGFIVDAATYKIIEDPYHAEDDPERLVWRMRVS